MNVEDLKQLLHEQNESVLSTNIPEVIDSVMTLYEKGVEVGMKIGGQVKINQACEWLDNISADDYMDSGIFQMSDLIIDLKKQWNYDLH